jgi:hypothetical protein
MQGWTFAAGPAVHAASAVSSSDGGSGSGSGSGFASGAGAQHVQHVVVSRPGTVLRNGVLELPPGCVLAVQVGRGRLVGCQPTYRLVNDS